MPLLTSNDYPAIRKAIDLGLTDGGLPPNVIEQDIYLQASEDWVKRGADIELGEGEDFEDVLDADELTHARRAGIYYCASLLAPVVNIPTSDAVSGVGASYTRKVMEPAANARRLQGLAESELAYIVDEEETEVATSYSGPAPTVSRW